jgi:hypothetical protein
MDVMDDYSTQNAAKMDISLIQPIFANTLTTFISSSPQVTNSTNRGQVSPQPLPTDVIPALQDIVTTYEKIVK